MAELPQIPLGFRETLDPQAVEWLERTRRAIGNTDTVFLDSSQNLADLVNAVTARVNLGVEIGVDVQAYNAALAAIVTAAITAVADEDNMASDSATQLATQQSIKAYVDTQTSGYTAPGMAFISSQDLTAAATADFTGFNPTLYDAYQFEIIGLLPATDGTGLNIHTSTDGGATYDNAAGLYSWGYRRQWHNGASTSNTSNSSASIVIADGIGNAAGEFGYDGTVKVRGAGSTRQVMITHHGTYQEDTAGIGIAATGSGMRLATADVDAIRFLFGAGNITSGTITMYGLTTA